MFLIQDGHHASGQIAEALEGNRVDGVIWSPGDETPELLAERTAGAVETKDDVVQALDPQFYVTMLADSNPKRLPRHGMSEMKLRGGAFSAGQLARTVGKVFDYLRGFPVTHLLSPTVAIAGMNDRSAQIALNLAETALEQAAGFPAEDEERPVFLSVAIEQYVLNEADAVNGLLDELTNHDVAGFYLLFEVNPELEAARQARYLAESLYVTYTLTRVQDKRAWVGYTGLSGYLHRAVGAEAFAAGGFQKQQWWSPAHWKAGEPGGGRGGPRPRIFLDRLLGSLLTETELQTIRAQRRDASLGADLIAGAGSLAAANRAGNPANPDERQCSAQLFDVCTDLDRRITGDLPTDIGRIRGEIADARSYFERIDAAGVQLEGRSNTTQIGVFEEAIDLFLARAEIQLP